MMRRFLAPLTFAAAVLTGACGSDSSPVTPVVPTPTAAPTAGPVTVQALGDVVAGVDVLLSDSTGATQAITQTDAAGQASFVLQPGAKAMLTLISQAHGDFGAIQLETFTDLGPGDKILTYVTSAYRQSATFGSIVIDFADRPPEGTLYYSIGLGCVSTTVFPPYQRLQGFVVDVPVTCSLAAGNTVDVVVTALNGDFLPLGYSTHAGVVLVSNTKTPVTFPDGWRTDLVPFPFAYKNVPASFTSLSLAVIPLRADGSGLGFFPPSFAVTPGTSDARTLLYPNAFAARIGYEAILRETADGTHGGTLVYARLPTTTPTSATVDLTADLPPAITDIRKTDSATFRPGVAWASNGSLASLDIGTFSFNWRRGKDYVNWAVHFPPTAVSPMNVPEIPDSLAFARPTGDDGTFLGSIQFDGDSTTTGYHDYIQAPFGFKLTDDVTLVSTARTP